MFVCALSFSSFSQDLTQVSGGITIKSQENASITPLISINGVKDIDYSYIVKTFNKVIETKARGKGYKIENFAVVNASEAFPDMVGKNESEKNQKLLVLKGLVGERTKYFAVWIPTTKEQNEHNNMYCSGMFIDCLWELGPDLTSTHRNRQSMGKLNLNVLEKPSVPAIPGTTPPAR